MPKRLDSGDGILPRRCIPPPQEGALATDDGCPAVRGNPGRISWQRAVDVPCSRSGSGLEEFSAPGYGPVARTSPGGVAKDKQEERKNGEALTGLTAGSYEPNRGVVCIKLALRRNAWTRPFYQGQRPDNSK